VLSDVSRIGYLDMKVQKLVVECYVKSLEYSHMVSLGFAVVALLLSLTIREKSLR